MLKLLCITFLSLSPDTSSTTPVARDHSWWVGRTAALQENVDKQGRSANVIFIGDSITQGWEGNGAAIWRKHIAPLGAINLGISGDRTEHVLWRMDHGHLRGLSPEVAVVMIGTNNFGQSEPDSMTEVLEGVVSVVDKLQSSLPDTKILLLDIFPRGQTFNGMRGSILQVNQALQATYEDDSLVTFLPIGHAFVKDDGSIDPAIMPDYLHLSATGYQVWFDAIKANLVKAAVNVQRHEIVPSPI